MKGDTAKFSTFEHKGYPSINLHETHFEIKAIDYWEFRSFTYEEVKEIKHFDTNDRWWMQLYVLTSFWAQIFSPDDPWVLKVTLQNGGSWDYKTAPRYNSELNKIIKQLQSKIEA